MNETHGHYYRVTSAPHYIEVSESKPYKEHSAKSFLTELYQSVVKNQVKLHPDRSTVIRNAVNHVVAGYDERLGILGIIGDLFKRCWGTKTERKEIQDLQKQIKDYLENPANVSAESVSSTENQFQEKQKPENVQLLDKKSDSTLINEDEKQEPENLQSLNEKSPSSSESSILVSKKKMLFQIKPSMNQLITDILKWKKQAIDLSEDFADQTESDLEEATRVIKEDQSKLAKSDKSLEDYKDIIDDLRVYGDEVLKKLSEFDASASQQVSSFKEKIDLLESRVAHSYLMQNDLDQAYDVIFDAFHWHKTTREQDMLLLLKSIMRNDLEHSRLDKAYERFDRINPYISTELISQSQDLREILESIRDQYAQNQDYKKESEVNALLRKYSPKT